MSFKGQNSPKKVFHAGQNSAFRSVSTHLILWERQRAKQQRPPVKRKDRGEYRAY